MNEENSFVEKNREIIEQLKNEIIKVFAEVEQPAKDNIALHECKECRGVREDFTDVKWQEADDELLETNFGSIPFFSLLAFNYFLPAYLLYTLNNFDKKYSEVCEFTIYALTPDKNWKVKNGNIASYWKEKFSLFTSAQMNVIYRFWN